MHWFSFKIPKENRWKRTADLLLWETRQRQGTGEAINKELGETFSVWHREKRRINSLFPCKASWQNQRHKYSFLKLRHSRAKSINPDQAACFNTDWFPPLPRQSSLIDYLVIAPLKIRNRKNEWVLQCDLCCLVSWWLPPCMTGSCGFVHHLSPWFHSKYLPPMPQFHSLTWALSLSACGGVAGECLQVWECHSGDWESGQCWSPSG